MLGGSRERRESERSVLLSLATKMLAEAASKLCGGGEVQSLQVLTYLQLRGAPGIPAPLPVSLSCGPGPRAPSPCSTSVSPRLPVQSKPPAANRRGALRPRPRTQGPRSHATTRTQLGPFQGSRPGALSVLSRRGAAGAQLVLPGPSKMVHQGGSIKEARVCLGVVSVQARSLLGNGNNNNNNNSNSNLHGWSQDSNSLMPALNNNNNIIIITIAVNPKATTPLASQPVWLGSSMFRYRKLTSRCQTLARRGDSFTPQTSRCQVETNSRTSGLLG